jgi:hypothetical protein
MNSKKIITDSLIYPFLDVKKFLTIFILFLTSFLVVPAIMASGYLLRIIENTAHGSYDLKIDKSRNTLIDGAKFLALFLIFAIVFYGILEVLETFLINFILLNGLGMYLIVAVFTIAFNMIFIMCLGHMAYEQRFRSAFDFKKIFNLIKKVGIKKYTFLVVIFTLLAEVINEVWSWVIMNLINFTGIWASISFFVLTMLIFTYILLFASRFTGLIYPNIEKI